MLLTLACPPYSVLQEWPLALHPALPLSFHHALPLPVRPALPCRDGSRMLLTPESSVEAQKALGADIILPLDELPPYHTTEEALAASLARSHRWMARRWGALAPWHPPRALAPSGLGGGAGSRAAGSGAAGSGTAAGSGADGSGAADGSRQVGAHAPSSTPLHAPARCMCSLKTHLANPKQQAMYSIVHGGVSLEVCWGARVWVLLGGLGLEASPGAPTPPTLPRPAQQGLMRAGLLPAEHAQPVSWLTLGPESHTTRRFNQRLTISEDSHVHMTPCCRSARPA